MARFCAIGWTEVVERRTIPGENHAADIAAVGQQIAQLTQERYAKGLVRDW